MSARLTSEDREMAWIGDAILALWAREWILRQGSGMDAREFAALTSNHSLSTVGNPTLIEAAIGRAFRQGGLPEANAWIAKHLEPRFLKQQKNRARERSRK